MDKKLKIGDWVRSYSKGVWQIYRIEKFGELDPVTGAIRHRESIFSKRFVNNAFKRSFSTECCSPDFVEKLDNSALKDLESFIADNKALYSKFINYVQKTVDLIYNARISIPEGKSSDSVEEELSGLVDVKAEDLIGLLNEKGYKVNTHPSWVAQFIANDHKCKDGQIMYTFERVLES